MADSEKVRIDKWLWAVRLYKTRALATEACSAGHVRLNGKQVKPAHDIKTGDIIRAHCGQVNRTVEVVAKLARRVGAKLVSDYMKDLTPPEEYERAKRSQDGIIHFPKGMGRPTKKQRRLLKPFSTKD